jgi:hypothetical protein
LEEVDGQSEVEKISFCVATNPVEREKGENFMKIIFLFIFQARS